MRGIKKSGLRKRLLLLIVRQTKEGARCTVGTSFRIINATKQKQESSLVAHTGLLETRCGVLLIVSRYESVI